MIQQYRISEKAIEDLEKIWIYTFKKWSKEQAGRYHKLLLIKLNS
jgi:toxin ParE1/3/4